MKRHFLLALCLFSITAVAETVPASLQRLINNTDPKMNAGMMVVDLTTGATLFEHKASQSMIPASNMKLFSEAVVMLALGQHYQIPTLLSTDAKTLTQGRLNGSLYLRMHADPSFNHQALFNLFNQLKKWQVKEITGDVVVQSDLELATPYPPGMSAKDEQYAYGAPVSPLILDENRLTVMVNPSSQAGQSAVVETASPNGVFAIENLVTTKSSAKGCGVSVQFDAEGKVLAKGCVGVGQMVQTLRVPVHYPMAYLTAHIRYQLKQMNIVWHGQVRKGYVPLQSLQIAKHDSAPIRDLMAATLKPSDNLYANSLYLLAANHLRQAPSSWSQAQEVTRDFLQKQTGIQMQTAIFAEGSGLSRLNRVSAYQTMSLLTYLYNKFPLSFEYISALPVSGFDGTLRRRLNHPDQIGLVRAKTGTLAGVLSLSGYLLTKNGHTLAFAIYMNTLQGTKPEVSGRYRGFIDSVCNALLHASPDNIHKPFFNLGQRSTVSTKIATAWDGVRKQWASWRGLEFLLKRELHAQPVIIVYRPNELVILDKGSNDARIWSAIKKLKASRRFGVALQSQNAPSLGQDSLSLMWIHAEDAHAKQWILRPAT
jgi:D-alanyl-D-alanine carboxypeptidase/D-alanyl-D-alanine-endopeptidase (penicillin-binding protein 4)